MKLFFNINGIKSLEHFIIMFGNIVCNIKYINVIIYIHILSPGYERERRKLSNSAETCAHIPKVWRAMEPHEEKHARMRAAFI